MGFQYQIAARNTSKHGSKPYYVFSNQQLNDFLGNSVEDTARETSGSFSSASGSYRNRF